MNKNLNLGIENNSLGNTCYYRKTIFLYQYNIILSQLCDVVIKSGYFTLG